MNGRSEGNWAAAPTGRKWPNSVQLVHDGVLLARRGYKVLPLRNCHQIRTSDRAARSSQSSAANRGRRVTSPRPGDIEHQSPADVVIQCRRPLRLRGRTSLHERGHLAGDTELLIEGMRCSDRPSALPRALSRVDNAESRARDVDIHMKPRVIEAGDGVDTPVDPTSADRRARGRQCHAQFCAEREVVVYWQPVLERQRRVATAVRRAPVIRTLPLVGLGPDQNGTAIVPREP
jgi:hypothetical protein